MFFSADNVLAIARREIGYTARSDPQRGSKYGRWATQVTGQQWFSAAARQVPWCNLFVSYCFAHAGQSEAIGMSRSSVFAYTVAHLSWFRSRGLIIPVGQAQPGDVVFFDWRPGGEPVEHVGIVERNLGGGVLQTIEGNTSGGRLGSQSHGGGVWRRKRKRGVAFVCRPKWVNTSPKHRQAQTEMEEEEMLLLNVDGKLWYQTGGILARMVADVDTLSKLQKVLKTIQISDAQLRANWIVIEGEMAADIAKAAGRVKSNNQLLTGYERMPEWMQKASLLNRILAKLDK